MARMAKAGLWWRERMPPVRWVLVAALVLIVLAGWLLLARDLDLLAAMRANREMLVSWREQHVLLAAALFVLVYVAVVVLSLPVNFAMTTLGGFLFGFLYGAMLATLAVTTGAVLVFSIARASFGARLRRHVLEKGSSGIFQKMDKGFRNNPLFYLVLLRLIPTLPSVVCNAGPAVFGVRTRTFAFATLAGVVPNSLPTAWIGASLSEGLAEDEIASPLPFEHPFLTALAVLALLLLAALPGFLKRRGA